jgi:dynein heavy chain
LRKGFYVPELNKKAIIFIDDLNMPIPEKYGAQPSIELFRNLIDHNFWYEK